MRFLVLHQLGFQGVWLACVLGGAAGHSGPGLLAALAFLGVSQRYAAAPRRDLGLALRALAIGLTMDLGLRGLGLVAYADGAVRLLASPLWLLALWAAFSQTLPVAFGWLAGRPALAALLGGIGGMSASWAGVRLGAMVLEAPPAVAFAGLAAGWALAVPLLLAPLAAPKAGPAPLSSATEARE